MPLQLTDTAEHLRIWTKTDEFLDGRLGADEDLRLYPAVMVETEDGYKDYGAAVEAGYQKGDDGVWRLTGEPRESEAPHDPRRDASNDRPLEFLGAGGDGAIPPWVLAVGALGVLWMVTSS